VWGMILLLRERFLGGELSGFFISGQSRVAAECFLFLRERGGLRSVIKT
jgi:hypothetical protein